MGAINRCLVASLLLVATACNAKVAMKAKTEGTESSMTAQTEITAEDLGQRFLEMIKNTSDFKELTPDTIQTAIGEQLTHRTGGSSGFYTLKLPNKDWQYSVIYNFDTFSPELSSVSLKLISSAEGADRSPAPCELDLNSYDTSIKSFGFKQEPITYNEIGWALALNYIRNNVRVQIIPHYTSSKIDGTVRDCVKSLSIHEHGE